MHPNARSQQEIPPLSPLLFRHSSFYTHIYAKRPSSHLPRFSHPLHISFAVTSARTVDEGGDSMNGHWRPRCWRVGGEERRWIERDYRSRHERSMPNQVEKDCAYTSSRDRTKLSKKTSKMEKWKYNTRIGCWKFTSYLCGYCYVDIRGRGYGGNLGCSSFGEIIDIFSLMFNNWNGSRESRVSLEMERAKICEAKK